MSIIKVMIVDDHVVVREGLKKLLEINNDIEVIAEAKTGSECLELLETLLPDVIFMDVRMPGISGIETARLVCQRHPQIKVVMLTIYEDDHYVTEAIKAGARGYVLKNVSRDELIKIVRLVMGDQAFLDPVVTAPILDRVKHGTRGYTREEKPALTQRELEVLACIVEGHTDRMIAESLCISEHTVRTHTKSLYRKLGVSSRAKAVAKAIHEKIVHVDD
jgi:DNA-binding NarL/FixJ family response regulator